MARIHGPLVIAALTLAPMAGVAQTAKPLAFEVASVRLSAPDSRGPYAVSPARVDMVRYPLARLIEMACRLHPSQLVAPGWVNDVRVDIHAIPPAGASRAQIPEMLQTLLAERFGLVAHTEQRQIQAYELTVADGGHKMREVAALNELTKSFPVDPGLPANALDTVSEELRGTVRLMMLPLGQRFVTEQTMYERRFTSRRTSEIDAVRMTMLEFASILTSNLDALVLDRTGLTGIYQFKIELPGDASVINMLLRTGTTHTNGGTPLTEPTGVSTFKAVEGLGLKLERRRAPLDVVVVDKILRAPTEN